MCTLFFQVALFLSPRFKRMAGLDDQDHQEVYNFVKTEMREIVVDEVVGNAHRVDEDYMMSFPEFDEEESTHWEGSGVSKELSLVWEGSRTTHMEYISFVYSNLLDYEQRHVII